MSDEAPNESIRNVIATRDLWIRTDDGPARPLKVLVWAPYLEEAPGIYVCECHIEGLQKEPMHVRGPDPMRALVSTLFAIGSILEAERKVWDRRIWARDESDPNEDLGFPLSNSNNT